MDVVVTIEKINDVQQYTSKKGDVYKKHSFVGKTNSQYPRTICFYCNEDTWNKLGVQIGKTYDVFFDINSREWNGKWFTEVNVWRISDVAGIQQPTPNQSPQPSTSPVPQTSGDNLPF